MNVRAEKSFTEKMLDKAVVTQKQMNQFFRAKNKRYSLRYPDSKSARMLPNDSEVFTTGGYMELTQKRANNLQMYMMEIPSTTVYGEYAY